MEKFINSLKKKKGFTLVEVIIVLVILAILAAILIPSLIGYIDKASEKASITECRNFVVAAQTIGSETYGENGTITGASGSTITAGSKTVDFFDEAFALSEIDSTKNFAKVTITEKGKITNVEFYDGTYLVTYNGSGYTAAIPKEGDTKPNSNSIAFPKP